eukprot:2754856-Pyramimonas_sp.AAC.1
MGQLGERGPMRAGACSNASNGRPSCPAAYCSGETPPAPPPPLPPPPPPLPPNWKMHSRVSGYELRPDQSKSLPAR